MDKNAKKNSSSSALRITVQNSNSSSNDMNKESQKRKASHNKEASDYVTPLTTIQTSDTNASITTIQTSDANISVTFEELFPGEKESDVDQRIEDAPIIASSNSLGVKRTSSPFIHTDSQPNSANLSVPTDFTILSPPISIPSSSSYYLLLNSLSLRKKAWDSVNFPSQTLSDIINSTQSSTSDPCKLRICSALNKLLCEFPSDGATRDEIHSQIDPSFHTILDVLELLQQNASLEKEVNRLKVELQAVQKQRGELQVANLDADNLRNQNQELRDSERSHQSTIAQLRSDLSKVQKEHMNLEASHANLEFFFLLLETEREEYSNSLPAVKIPPLNVSEDEEYPETDSDYELVSDDEKDQEDEEDQIEKYKYVDKTNAETENPRPNTDAEKSLVEQDVAAEHV
ncbi:altered inheritance of mitochondria protein 44-like [Papaver somniferum]|uniref:altered inheritance of mitochondria protein 44-like n=1 Tax=Papaver somniferum TaxID=3469 RepID=UPI000E701259|nr:altered inheritance of mitochondria protein 44-like [Papaver somniferum]